MNYRRLQIASALALSLAVRATLADNNISYSGGTYSQNFNSLWTNNTTPPVNLEPGLTPIQIGAAVNSPIDLTGPSADFVTTIPAISTMTGWYAINFGGNSLPLNYDVSNGSDNGTSNASAALYAFYDPAKQGSGNNLALGAISASETGNVVFGMKIINNSTGNLNAISLNYTGALFHEDTGAKTMTFGYALANSTSAIPISGTTGYGALNVGGFATGPSGAATLTQNLSVSNLPLASAWAPGQALWVTWQMGVGGSGQGLGIDDLSFSATNLASLPTLTWTHVGNGAWDTIAANWAGASTTFSNGNFNVIFPNIASDTLVTVDAAGVTVAASVTINNSANNYTFAGGSIGGSVASLTLNGTGTTTLTAPNSYSVATNLNAGTLIISDNNQLGGANAALIINGGKLKLAATLNAGARSLNVNSAGATIDTSGFNASFGATSASLPIIHGELHVTGGGNLNLGIQPTFGSNAAPAGRLVIDPGSTVTLTGNTRSSATDMWDGGTINGILVLDTTVGGRFNFDSIGTFNLADGTSTGVNGTSVLSGTGEIQVPQGSKWTVVSGKGQLDSTGVVISNTSGAMGANIAVNIHLNSREGADGAHPAFTRTDVTNPNFYKGTVIPAGNFVTVLGGTKNNGNSGKGGIGPGFSNLIISGVISGDSDINIGNDYKSGGSGNITFAAHNTYHGVTMLNGGGTGTPVLYLGIDDALPTDTDVVFGTLSGAGTPSLDLNGHTQTIRSLSVALAANSPNLNQINNSGPNPSTLTISGAINPAYPYNGQINDLGPTATDPLGSNFTATGGSTTALVKDGSSTFILGQYLDNAHFSLSTYSGGTTVRGGTLQIPFDGALGANTGSLTLDGGTISIKTPDLLYNGLTGETSVTWTTSRPLTITANGGTVSTPTFTAFENSTNNAHTLVASVLFTGDGGNHWGGTLHLAGTAASTMTLNGGIGSVSLSGLPVVQIGATVSLIVGGSSDPFTDSLDITKHVAIQSDGAFSLTAGSKAIAALSGIGTATIAPSATLTSNGVTLAGTWTINGTHMIRADTGNLGTSKVNALPAIAHTGSGGSAVYSGVLNLSDSKLIVQTTDLTDKTNKIAALNEAITAGANGAAWNGKGITSSAAFNDPNHYGVGVFDNKILGLTTFGGQSVDTNSILTAVAHLGDANRNGIVDIQDLTIVANNWQQSRNNWAAGDLNRTGLVDIQDLTIVANNWQQTSTFNQSAGPMSSLGGGTAAVPEPASLVLLSLGTLLIGIRRRK